MAETFARYLIRRGWQKNAVIGIISYILGEGREYGFYGWEGYWVAPDPNGRTMPYLNTRMSETIANGYTPVLGNQKWLDWLTIKASKNAYPSGFKIKDNNNRILWTQYPMGLGLSNRAGILGYL